MRSTHRALACCLMALLLAATPARAQEDPPVGGLVPGTEVRVETVDGRRLEGRVTRVDSVSIVLIDRRGEQHVLARERLRRAWRRTASTGLYARRGAIAGAVAFGGYLGLLAGALCESESCTGDYAEGLTVGAPLGALGGAVAGAVLGSFVHRWDLIDDGWPGSIPPQTGWRLHLGAARTPSGDGPDPVALVRAAVDREIGPGKGGFLELSHVAYAEQRLGPVGYDTTRDAGTWSLALGLTQSLASEPDIRLSASAGVARSSATIGFTGPPPPGQVDERTIQYGTQLSVGVEAGWSPDFARGIAVGLEARYDYVPLFFDGVQLFTLSAAVRG